MATFVLIHGGCHGGWCWERIVPLLHDQGHRAFAPDLPGTGSDRTPLSQVTLQGWAKFVADLIRQQNEPVVLVGHSLGGPVISQAAEFVPDRIKSLVYLAAIMPSDGGTAGDLVPARDDSETWVIVSEDQKSFSIPAQILEKYFYNTTQAEWIARAAEKVTPLPFSVLAEPLSLSRRSGMDAFPVSMYARARTGHGCRNCRTSVSRASLANGFSNSTPIIRLFTPRPGGLPIFL